MCVCVWGGERPSGVHFRTCILLSDVFWVSGGPGLGAHAFQPVIHLAHRGSLARCLRAPAVCACSVCVQCVRAGAKRGLPLCARAQQQQQQADKVFPGALTARSHPATTALTPGCCEGKTPAPPAPRFAQPKLGPPFPRGCLRALEPLMAARAPLVRVTEAAAPPRIACVRLSRGRRSGGD